MKNYNSSCQYHWFMIYNNYEAKLEWSIVIPTKFTNKINTNIQYFQYFLTTLNNNAISTTYFSALCKKKKHPVKNTLFISPVSAISVLYNNNNNHSHRIHPSFSLYSDPPLQTSRQYRMHVCVYIYKLVVAIILLFFICYVLL